MVTFALRLVLLLLAACLSGCLSSKLIPSQQVMQKMNKIEIIALEEGPVEIAQAPHFAGLIPAGRGFVPVFSTSAAGKDSIFNMNRKEASIKITRILNEGSAWLPSELNAKEALINLSAKGYQVYFHKPIQSVPGTNCEKSEFLRGDWMECLRAWYDEDVSSINYAIRTDDLLDCIVEIGILNYSVLDNKFLIQVAVKLVNPRDRSVIGRTRKAIAAELGDADRALADSGKVFKKVFLQSSSVLINKCFCDLGFKCERDTGLKIEGRFLN